MNDTYDAKIRCICGRVYVVGDDPVTCACGASLKVEIDKKGLRPWATTPDGYDLGTRKHNKPAIVGWKELKHE